MKADRPQVRASAFVLAAVVAALVAGLALGVSPAAATQIQSTQRLTTDSIAQRDPDLSDAAYCYQQWGGDTGWDIYAGTLPDAATPICTATGDQILPRVSGRFVVWEDHRAGNADIYAYDLVTKTEFVVCDEPHEQLAPRISGTWVVWQDKRGSDWEIYGATIDPATDTVTPQNGVDLSNELHDQTQPDVSGDTVVWVDTRWGDPDIAGYDRSAGYFFPICTAAGVQYQPAISGDTVVWSDLRSEAGSATGGTGSDVYACDLLTGYTFPVCRAAGDQTDPDVDQDLVVWTDGRPSATAPDVRGLDLTSHQTLAIAVAPHDQVTPVVSDYRVVWAGNANAGKYDIYSATLTPWTATIKIDKGQAWTRTTRVTLHLRGQGKTGVVAQMLLANKGGTAPQWESYWPLKSPWYLTSGDGAKTVTVTFQDLSSALSPPVSASITLDTHGPVPVVPKAMTATKGAVEKFGYRVNDNLSPTADVTIKVLNSKGAIVRVWTPGKVATGVALHRKFVCSFAAGTYKVKVWATDLAGNVQQKVGVTTMTVK